MVVVNEYLINNQSLCSFFSKHFVKVQVVQPYNSIDTVTAWKNSCFILPEIRVPYVPIAVNAFHTHMLTLLSVDEILLPRYAK